MGVALIGIMTFFLIEGLPEEKVIGAFLFIGLGVLLLGVATYAYREYREEKQDAKILQEEEQQEQLTTSH